MEYQSAAPSLVKKRTCFFNNCLVVKNLLLLWFLYLLCSLLIYCFHDTLFDTFEIFAIQRADPAPFYLFDEVDAALDDQYRSAVAQMIKRQSENTQFIISTFHKPMAEIADQWCVPHPSPFLPFFSSFFLFISFSFLPEYSFLLLPLSPSSTINNQILGMRCDSSTTSADWFQ